MDGRVVSVVRQTRSATCGERGTEGADREWSGSQAGFSNSRAARYKGSGREWSGSQARGSTGDGQQRSGSSRAEGQEHRIQGTGAHGKTYTKALITGLVMP
ncbi:unnamed protein product [Staurois parvus]|uniref:Uncharacterized protein n=1 Tax=Staurois parvus TaxID=386267 RepID=A0ABN9CWS4_9NEOB|nr:unnamed protein product [Staurois parvus]